jgi:hypothetical protein
MLSADPLQRFIFIAPLPLMLVLVLTVKFPWRMAVYVWLAGTFAQDALSFALYPGHLAAKDLPAIILSFYPFALFPFGLWSAILGVLGWWLAAKLTRGLTVERRPRLIAGAMLGSAAGAAFAFTCGYAFKMIEGGYQPAIWLSWEIAGFVAGAIDGAIIASFLPREGPAVSPLQPGVERSG